MGVERLTVAGMYNDPLDAMNELKGLTVFIRDGLQRLAPSAIENGIGGRDTCMRRSILVEHDVHESIHHAQYAFVPRI